MAKRKTTNQASNHQQPDPSDPSPTPIHGPTQGAAEPAIAIDDVLIESIPDEPEEIAAAFHAPQPDMLFDDVSEGDPFDEASPCSRRVQRNAEKPPKPVELTGDELRHAIETDLRQGGVLSRSLPGYQERPAQLAMARHVVDALTNNHHLVCEASTGTGKSIAYLLPIVRSGKVAIVSTANKALQEQLFYKDIPFLQRHIQPFPAALVKGMGNYLCLERYTEEKGFQVLAPTLAFSRMEDLMGDFSVWDGDLDLLPTALPGELRARLTTDSDQCAWRSCPHFGDCYVRQMRETARKAQIIVVNHTLLLLDAVMDGYFLPERDLIVIDEAHHLEEEATRAFTATVTPSRVQSLLALRRLREHADAQAIMNATIANTALWEALLLVAKPDARGRQNLRQPLQEGLRLSSEIDTLANSLQHHRPLVMDDKEEQLFEKLVKRTRQLASDLRLVFGVTQPDERVYYVEYSRGPGGRRAPQPSVSAAPLSVTELLREKLFDRITTIATSATLAVNNDFKFFRRRVGLPAAREVTLPLTFDYEHQAILYLPRMRLEPAFGAASGPYLDELASQMEELVEASRGRAFLLFSSQNALQGVYDRLEERLSERSFSLLAQGRDASRTELLRLFRERPQAVLFGLKSFWEGVDVVGAALSLVVIDKLPFDPPDDPVNEARVNRMRAAGENWFGEYTLPQAILRLKQGIGRLLRSHEDRGVMAILDKRLYTKGYGRQIVSALPPARRTNDIADVRAFFAEDE